MILFGFRQKSNRLLRRNFASSQVGNRVEKGIRSILVALGLCTFSFAVFATKEFEPISGKREISLEPESVSFNDDFIAGMDQKAMYHLQTELSMIKTKSFYHNFYDEELRKCFPSNLDNQEKSNFEDMEPPPFPLAIKFYTLKTVSKLEHFKFPSLSLPFTLPSLPKFTFYHRIRDFIEEKWVEYAPDALYHFRDNEIYLELYQIKLQVGDKRRELVEDWHNLLDSLSHRKDFTIPKMLLPPPLPYGQPPITIMIDYDILFGGNEQYRAGGDFFLKRVSTYSETVFNSGASYMYYLSPDHIFMHQPPVIHHRLSAESWSSAPKRGHPQMDLPRLNRDLSKVLVLSTNMTHYQYYQSNVLIIPDKDWWEDPKDTDLFDLVPIIKFISDEVKSGKDVRDVLKNYQDVDPARLTKIALEKNQIIQQSKQQAQQAQGSKR